MFNRLFHHDGQVVDLNIGTPERAKVVRVHCKPFQNASQKLRRIVQPHGATHKILKFDLPIGGEAFFTAFDMFVQFVYLQDYQGPINCVRDEFKSLLLHTQVYALGKRLVATRLSELALGKGEYEVEIIEEALLREYEAISPVDDTETQKQNARDVLYEVVHILYKSWLEPADDGKIDGFRLLIATLSGKCFKNLITDPKFAELGGLFPGYVKDVVALIRGRYQSEAATYAREKAIPESRASK